MTKKNLLFKWLKSADETGLNNSFTQKVSAKGGILEEDTPPCVSLALL